MRRNTKGKKSLTVAINHSVQVGVTRFERRGRVVFGIEKRSGKRGDAFRVWSIYYAPNDAEPPTRLTVKDANGEFCGTFPTEADAEERIEQCRDLIRAGNYAECSPQSIAGYIDELKARAARLPTDEHGRPLGRERDRLKTEWQALQHLITLGLSAEVRDASQDVFEKSRASVDWARLFDDGANMLENWMGAAIERVPTRSMLRDWLQSVVGGPTTVIRDRPALEAAMKLWREWESENPAIMTGNAQQAALPALIEAVCALWDGRREKMYQARGQKGDPGCIPDLGAALRAAWQARGAALLSDQRMKPSTAQMYISTIKRLVKRTACQSNVFGCTASGPRIPFWATERDKALSPNFTAMDVRQGRQKEPLDWSHLIALVQNRKQLTPHDRMVLEYMVGQGERIGQWFCLHKDQVDFDEQTHSLIHDPNGYFMTKAGGGKHTSTVVRQVGSERFYRKLAEYMAEPCRDEGDPLVSESTGARSWRKLADGFTERFKTYTFRVCGREITPHEVRVWWCNLVDHLGETIETDTLAKQRVKKMIAPLGAHTWETYSKAYRYDAEQLQAMREYCTYAGQLIDLVDGEGPRPEWMPGDWLTEYGDASPKAMLETPSLAFADGLVGLVVKLCQSSAGAELEGLLAPLPLDADQVCRITQLAGAKLPGDLMANAIRTILAADDASGGLSLVG